MNNQQLKNEIHNPPGRSRGSQSSRQEGRWAQRRVPGKNKAHGSNILWNPSGHNWASEAQVRLPWQSPRHRRRRLWRGLRRPPLSHPPPCSVQSKICRTSNGKKGPGEDGGGWDCLGNLLSPEVFVRVCCAQPSPASLEQVGGGTMLFTSREGGLNRGGRTPSAPYRGDQSWEEVISKWTRTLKIDEIYTHSVLSNFSIFPLNLVSILFQ